MATNVVYDHIDTLFLAVDAGVVSGDPYADGPLGTAGQVGISGIALIDRDANGNATIKTSPKTVVRVSVSATTDDTSPATGGAVARGDKIFKNASTELLSKDVDGIHFGWALGTKDANGAYPDGTVIASTATGTIDVILA